MPSFKATDGSHHLLQGQDSKHSSEDWPKILDFAVHKFIDELDRVIFEEEESVVMLE